MTTRRPEVRKAVVGSIVGVLLYAGIIITRYLLDDTIRSPEDIEKHIAIPTIGTIPIQNGLNGSESERNREKRTSTHKLQNPGSNS